MNLVNHWHKANVALRTEVEVESNTPQVPKLTIPCDDIVIFEYRDFEFTVQARAMTGTLPTEK